MKLIIQIPCFNEAETLPLVFEKMPKQIEGITSIEFQIIDDGSTDNTTQIAKELGVQHIIQIRGKNKKWLGRAFKLGVENALKLDADILVNTDGDNQYPSELIPKLIKPILEAKAHVVIGNREPGNFNEFSPLKRFLQKIGSNTVGIASGSHVPDAVSGFRAFSKEALLKINLVTRYTYTVDSLMQAIEKGLAVEWIKIKPNEKTRDSRLINSLFSKVRKSGLTILRLFAIYQPFKIFAALGIVFFLPGLFLILRFLYYYIAVPNRADGFIQSLVIGGVLIITSVQIFVLGILADLLSVNRMHIEDILSKLRKLESKNIYDK